MKKLNLIVITCLCAGFVSLRAQNPTPPSLSDWRILPQSVSIVPSDPDLSNVLQVGSDFLSFTTLFPASEKVITVKLPVLQNSGMLTYSVDSSISNVSVDSYESPDGVTWTLLQGLCYTNNQGDDLQKVDIPKSLSNKWLRVVFKNAGNKSKNIREIGLYEFRTSGLNQYFLMIGASITESSGGHTLWKQTINSRLGNQYQPVVFNWSFGGDNTQSTLNRIDVFLQQHPHASYVMIETGGNDVTPNRPLTYQKSTEPVYRNMVSNVRLLIQKVKDAGKIPVFSRMSFRNYLEKSQGQVILPAVNSGLNQENGSLPYNLEYDEIIKEMTPQFWDATERRGMIDFYQLTLNNQSWLLSSDGVHFKGPHSFNIRNFWTDYAFKYIYTGQKSPVIPYTEYIPNLTTLATQAVALAEAAHTNQAVWNARILVEQIANTATRVMLLDRLLNIGNASTPLQISNQPSDFTITEGGTATFGISVSGASPITYQWQKNGINITGAVASTYTFACTLADSGSTYRCVVSNGAETIVSSYAVLTVNALVNNVTHGLTARYYTNTYASIGTTPTLTRIDPDVNFSWGINAPAGVSNNAFAVRWTGTILVPSTGTYTFYTQSDDGIKLWVNNQLLINKWVYQGLTEWSGNINLIQGTAYPIVIEYFEGNGDATCKLLWSAAGMSKQTVPSSVLFPENTSTTVLPPSIIQQPQHLTVTEGSLATFSVTASGTAPFTYQWQKNSVNIPGATSSSYAYTSVFPDSGATYRVIISNTAGTVTSNSAILTVHKSVPILLPTITLQPQNFTITEGGVATFAVTATGTAPLTYQWQKNGVNIPGATSVSYWLSSALADNGAVFRAVVTNPAGSVFSDPATLTVVAPQPLGNGLTARYYSNVYASFNTSVALERVDANVDFNWGAGAPHPTIPINRFAVRWTGKIKVNSSETYTFYTQSDDGVKLWIDDVLIIDKWVYQGIVEWNGSIALQAGVYHDIKLEYFEGSSDAVCKLLLSSPSVAKHVVPSAYLFPENSAQARTDIGNPEQEDFALYPNPFNGIVTLKMNPMIRAAQEKISVENTLGQVVYTDLLEGIQDEFILRLEHLEEGLYVLAVNGKKQKLYKK